MFLSDYSDYYPECILEHRFIPDNGAFKLMSLVKTSKNMNLWLFITDDYNSHDPTLLCDIIKLHFLLLFSVRDLKGFDLNS